jgi:tight adherence protein C
VPEEIPSLLTGNGIVLGVAALVFATTLLLFWVLRQAFKSDRTAATRIQELTGAQEAESFLANEGVQNLASQVSTIAAPTAEDERNILRRKLIQAGWRQPNNLEMFSALRVVLALALPMILALIAQPDKLVTVLLFVLLGASAGYYIPGIVLNSRVQDRQKLLLRPFPDSLDLLVSSVEAGLGLDAAFKRVAEEMENAAPELARELQLVNHEVAAGVPRIDALRHLDTRTGLEEVAALVNVLTQAERFGTSVARALRVHADMVRTRRMLAAEEQAAKVSPKLTVAMILFILPCLIIILIGPAVINVIRILLPAMTGSTGG